MFVWNQNLSKWQKNRIHTIEENPSPITDMIYKTRTKKKNKNNSLGIKEAWRRNEISFLSKLQTWENPQKEKQLCWNLEENVIISENNSHLAIAERKNFYQIRCERRWFVLWLRPMILHGSDMRGKLKRRRMKASNTKMIYTVIYRFPFFVRTAGLIRNDRTGQV